MYRSTLTTSLTTLAALGLAATTFALPATQAKPAAPATSTAQAKTAPAAPAQPANHGAKWASGQVERVDQAAGTLVVKQGAHELTFALAKDVKLTEGHKAINHTDLGAAVGHRAKVLYTAEGTHKIAHSVELEAPHAAKKPAHPSL